MILELLNLWFININFRLFFYYFYILVLTFTFLMISWIFEGIILISLFFIRGIKVIIWISEGGIKVIIWIFERGISINIFIFAYVRALLYYLIIIILFIKLTFLHKWFILFLDCMEFLFLIQKKFYLNSLLKIITL